MEIKFKSQASIALEQLFVALEKMTVHFAERRKRSLGWGGVSSTNPEDYSRVAQKRMISESV
jgi:hypothetical protein